MGLRWTMVWVASACTSSDEPTPKASAPMPPWVQVWLSPQIRVVPGKVSASSGPMMCTMPLPSWPRSNRRMPYLAVVARMLRISGSPGGKVFSVRPGAVEMAWSGVP